MLFADRLAHLEPGGQTDIRAAIKRFNSFGLRRGLLVVVSDFFDPGGMEAVIAALKQVRHKLLLVQLHRRSDAEPDVQRGCPPDRLRVAGGRGCFDHPGSDQALPPRSTTSSRRISPRFAKSRNAGLLRIDVDEEIVPQLAGIFEGGRYVV